MEVSISFSGSLNVLLPPAKREQKVIVMEFSGRRSIKDLIQSLGIPHTEVGRIRVNDYWVDLSYILRNHDDVHVLPLLPYIGRNAGIPERFLCDVHLIKLARRLRLLGFDTSFNHEWDDPQLAEICQTEKRLLLTRDRGLLMRNQVTRGRLIRNTDPELQVREVLRQLNLGPHVQPFTRCIRCNGLLESVSPQSRLFKEKLKKKIPAKVLSHCTEFSCCMSCGKTFWKGSHYDKLLERIRDYRTNA